MAPIGPTVCIALAIAGLLSNPTPAEYPCYRASAPPLIDGDVAGDPAWQSLPAAMGFSVLGGGYAVAKQASAWACWDDEAIYVAMTCEEPDVRLLSQKVRDGGPFWEEDGVEIFVQPGGAGQVYQFGVTAFGAKGCWEGHPDITQAQAAATRGQASYSIEVRIPFAVLGETPRAGDSWRGSFCRNIHTYESGGDKFTSWPPLNTRFLEPENYAIIHFLGPAPEEAELAPATNALNAAYRAHLISCLDALAREAREYLPALGEASRDHEFGPRARELRREWWRLGRVRRGAPRLGTADLRSAVASAQGLVDASYHVKYAYLIAKLLREP